MAATEAAMWVQDVDDFRIPIWRNKNNGEVRYINPSLSDPEGRPLLYGNTFQFSQGRDLAAQQAWEEVLDENTRQTYWWNRSNGEITFVDPKVATKAQPPLPPSFPPPGRYPLEPPLSNQPPMSPLPSHQPALPSTQAMPSYDLPQSLGNPPSQPPSMPSRHQPRSDQMPPSQTPAWSSPQPFASSFPPPPAHPPGWTSEQPQPFYSSPTPSFTPLSPPPPPPPPPPQEFQQWQWQPSAPPPPPPPPPSEMPPTALTPNSNTSDNVQKGDGGGGGGDGGSDGRKPGTEAVTDTEAMSWEPTLQKREQNDWSRRVNAMGKREWFNQKTGLAQNHRPDCLRKYR